MVNNLTWHPPPRGASWQALLLDAGRTLSTQAPQLSFCSRREAGHPERSDRKGAKHPEELLNREAGALPCPLRLQTDWGLSVVPVETSSWVPQNWRVMSTDKGCVQWLKIRLPMPGMWVRSLVWKDPLCNLGATKTADHTSEATRCDSWSLCALEPALCRQEKPLQWDACSPQLGKVRASSEETVQPK